jgi:NADH-quinone oxidoreductase subunit C
MNETETHFNELKKNFMSKLLKIEIFDRSKIRLQVKRDDLIEIMEYIAIKLHFTSLEAVSGLDWETYFEVVYHLDRWDGDPTVLQIHVQLEDRENPWVPSVTSIWASANWHERELYDLFGINIENHPNLKRLLLPEEWDEYEHKHISELYPMRREYKLPEKPYSFKPHPK